MRSILDSLLLVQDCSLNTTDQNLITEPSFSDDKPQVKPELKNMKEDPGIKVGK